MAQKTISSGTPPIVWSTVDEAFTKINSNFQELYSAVSTLDPASLDFERLNSNITPRENDTYSLGTPGYRWQNLYISKSISIGGSQITNEGSTIDLPSGSTVGGSLIIDPSKTFFKTVSVNDGAEIVAESFGGTLNLESGVALDVVIDSSARSIMFNNTGVTSITANSGLSANRSTGSITLSNTGVTGLTTGLGLSSSGSTGSITLANTGVVQLSAGTGITLSNGGNPDGSGRVIITNSAPAGFAFRSISIFGTVYSANASNAADTAVFKAGTGMNMITDGAKTVTFTNTGVTALTSGSSNITLSGSTGNITVGFDNRLDIVGSVFADNSTLLVDGVSGTIPASVVQGTFTGYHVGDTTGSVFADDSTKLIDAVEGKIVGPVYANVYGNTYGTHIGIVNTSLIGSSDSSVIQVTSPITMQGDVRVENDLILGSTGGARITGEFSNATFANRPVFQSTTTNGLTCVGAAPNGTGTFTDFRAYSSADVNNSAYGSFHADSTGHVGVNSAHTGTATTQPLTLQVDSTTVISVTAGGFTNAGVQGTASAAPTIASSGTIAPTKDITFISGTAAIATITAPSPISAGGGQITLIPTGVFTTTTAGNIALATTAVVGKALIMTYDSGTAKWYPSY